LSGDETAPPETAPDPEALKVEPIPLDAELPPPPPEAAPAMEATPSLSSLVRPLTVEALSSAPPPRPCLVRDGDGNGVLVRGRVGMLGAPGGGLKSWAVVQLAIAVATGGDWFGLWPVEQGRVLLVLAEEDFAEAQRRIHFALKGGGELQDDAKLSAVVDNITLVPAAGVGLALTFESNRDTGALPETPRVQEFRDLLRAAADDGKPYALVVFDPSSRFAGAVVEKDSAAATRYVQVLETFTALACGRPTILLPAHTRKRGKDDEPGSTDAVRGSSALRDAVRWVAMLERRPFVDGAPELLDLRVGKSNYTRKPTLALCSDPELEGALRVATAEDFDAYDAAKSAARTGSAGADALRADVLKALSATPMSTSALAKRLRRDRHKLLPHLEALQRAGAVVSAPGAHNATVWSLVPTPTPTKESEAA
jgi:hypothetical protein